MRVIGDQSVVAGVILVVVIVIGLERDDAREVLAVTDDMEL